MMTERAMTEFSQKSSFTAMEFFQDSAMLTMSIQSIRWHKAVLSFTIHVTETPVDNVLQVHKAGELEC